MVSFDAKVARFAYGISACFLSSTLSVFRIRVSDRLTETPNDEFLAKLVFRTYERISFHNVSERIRWNVTAMG